MECELCGTKMSGSSQSTGKGNPRRKYYICPKHEKRHGGSCENKGIEALSIENRVLEDLVEVINQYLNSNLIDNEYFKESINAKNRLKISLEKSIKNMQDSIDKASETLIDPDLRESKKNAIERLIETNTSKINDLKSKVKLAKESIDVYEAIINKKNTNKINKKTLENNEIVTRQLIRVMVNKVVVGKEDVSIEILE